MKQIFMLTLLLIIAGLVSHASGEPLYNVTTYLCAVNTFYIIIKQDEKIEQLLKESKKNKV